VFGFNAFSHQRAVLAAGRLPLVSLFYPPYTGWKTGLGKRLVRTLGWI
jgi:aldehyde dehydrogenase (NAD+)